LTAEVIVMNRQGVALAADSAVTLGGGTKVLNTANKVFMISPNYSIGILIYNNANLMDIPWEIIIKDFRDYCCKESINFKTLEKCSENFIDFLKKSKDKYALKEQCERFFLSYSSFILDQITREIWENFYEDFYEDSLITSDGVKRIVKNKIDDYYNYLNERFKDIFDQEKTKTIRTKITSVYQEEIKQLIKKYFDCLPRTKRQTQKLEEICGLIFTKREFLTFYTGFVVAGFGDSELFPSFTEFHILGYLCGELLYYSKKSRKIGFNYNYATNETKAEIVPFATKDTVENLLYGSHPNFDRAIRNELEKHLDRKKIDDILFETNKMIFKDITVPIIDTIDKLTKDQLANVARTFVNLTSFMKQVTMELETVGGPIDVAVISKKDGFIWIDRKHYFDIEKNLHFKRKNIEQSVYNVDGKPEENGDG